MSATDPWLSYWSRPESARLLFAPESAEYVRRLRAAVPLTPTARVLDFGVGLGGPARLLAPHVGTLFYWDANESMMASADATLKPAGNARRWDGVGPVDAVLVNSVVQYMLPGELAGRVREWAAVLAPGGVVVISDIISPGHVARSDMWSLFWFSLRRGYLLRAVRNTLAELTRYKQAKQGRPLATYSEAEIARMAAEAGLGCRYLPRNVTHFRGRRTAVLTKPA